MRTARHSSECSSRSWSWSCSGVTGSVTQPLCCQRVEERKPLGLVLDLAPGAGVEAAERLPADAAVVEPPRAGDGAVDEEGRDRLRHLRREDPRPMLLGKDTRPPRMDEEHGVPRRQEAHRRRRLGVGQRRAREVEELAARLVAEAAQGSRSSAGAMSPGFMPAHWAMSARDAGPNAPR